MYAECTLTDTATQAAILTPEQLAFTSNALRLVL